MNALINEGELSFTELAKVLDSDSKQDFAVPAESILPELIGDDCSGTELRFPRFQGASAEEMPLTRYAADQMHTRLSSGMKGVTETLRQHGMRDTYRNLVGDLLEKNKGTTFRLRTLNNDNLLERSVRAVVSDKYKPIDDDLVFGASVPRIIESDRFKPFGGNKTDVRTAMKWAEKAPSISIKSGNRTREMSIGFIQGNSEVGASSAYFQMFLYDWWCSNGCVFGKFELANVSWRHIGARIDIRHGLIEQSALEQAERASLQRALTEATETALSLRGREKIREIIEASERAKVTRTDLPEFFGEVAKQTGLTKREGESLMLHMHTDEMTKLGVQAAVTSLAQQAQSYERRLELEAAGGRILTMTDRQWNALAAA